MAVYVPIVSEFVDKGVKQAKAWMNELKTSVGNAEGAMGKFKAGSAVALDFVNSHMQQLAMAGGAALVKFAQEGITQFQNLALGAGKLSAATGLAIGDASRYMEVLGDIGVDLGSFESAIGRLGREAFNNKDKLKALGIEIEYAKDGSVKINETFLNVIQRLHEMKDPTERAAAAQQILGKGWQSMSTLIETGADNLSAALARVSDSKVISRQELENARKFRDAMDDLKDVVEDVSISVGASLVPALSDLAEQSRQLMGAKVNGKSVTEYFGSIGKLALDQVNPLSMFGNTMSGVRRVTDENSSALERGYGVIETTMSAVPILGTAFSKLGTAMFGATEDTNDYSAAALALTGMIYKARGEIDETTLALEDQADNVLPKITYAWDAFLGQLDREDAFANAKEQINSLTELAAAAFSGEAIDAGQFEQASRDAQRAIADLVASLLAAKEITGAEANTIKLFVEMGQIGQAMGYLESGTAGAASEDLRRIRLRGGRAMGGPVAAGATYLVGENGPELFTPSSSGMIGGGGGANITINMPQGVNGDDVVRAIQNWVRSNGAVPMTTTTAIRR